jgi:hypothetical protein
MKKIINPRGENKMNGINPKTDWQPGDGIKASDLNDVGNQFWENVYSVFDVGGDRILSPNMENFNEEEYILSEREIIIPPQTKLLLTHILTNPNTTVNLRVYQTSTSWSTTFTKTNCGTERWLPDTAPVVFTNNTNAETTVKLRVWAANNTGRAALSGGSARVIIVPI